MATPMTKMTMIWRKKTRVLRFNEVKGATPQRNGGASHGDKLEHRTENS